MCDGFAHRKRVIGTAPPPIPRCALCAMRRRPPAPRAIALLPCDSYSAARKLRDGSRTVFAHARRSLPLKRRSG